MRMTLSDIQPHFLIFPAIIFTIIFICRYIIHIFVSELRTYHIHVSQDGNYGIKNAKVFVIHYLIEKKSGQWVKPSKYKTFIIDRNLKTTRQNYGIYLVDYSEKKSIYSCSSKKDFVFIDTSDFANLLGYNEKNENSILVNYYKDNYTKLIGKIRTEDLYMSCDYITGRIIYTNINKFDYKKRYTIIKDYINYVTQKENNILKLFFFISVLLWILWFLSVYIL